MTKFFISSRVGYVTRYDSFSMLLAPLVSMPLLVSCTPPGLEAASQDQAADREGAIQSVYSDAQILALSLDHLDANLRDLGVRSVDDLQETRIEADNLGLYHTRFQQYYRDVPVFGGELIVHMDTNGLLSSITSDVVRNIRPDLSVAPRLTPQQAISAVLNRYDCVDCLSAPSRAGLWVQRYEGQDKLVYKVELFRIDGTEKTSMPVIFVDANSGAEIWRYDNLQTAGATGTGTSNYYGTLTLTDYYSGTTYYMEDVTRKVGTFNYNNTTASPSRSTDADNVYNSSAQKSIVDAQYGLASTYDYFKNVHGRNGLDGNGGPAAYTAADGVTGLISAAVHYSTRYNNAFWDGTKLIMGDGDGTTFSSMTTLDITAHELTHAITEREAGLTYSGESGALSESISDVFGVLVDRYARGETANTWRIGEECYTPTNGTSDALRYMDDPHLAANGGFTTNDDPDHYSERYTGTSDNGGVHINSGIPNKAFYLVAKGGSHHLGGSMTGIGADAAGLIWYKALTTYMTSSTNFSGARTATLNAAAAIYGSTTSTQYLAVCNAWALVGVGTSCTAVPPPTGGELLTNGGFETAITPWVVSGTGALYTANGAYPQAGTGYIYFGGSNSISGQIYQPITIPAGTTKTLSFYLNVSSAETTTTTQYDKLFIEVRNSAGTLLSTLGTFSNLNKVATAGSYGTAKTYSLASYAGQTIRIQFRSTTDSSSITTFRVDTASVK